MRVESRPEVCSYEPPTTYTLRAHGKRSSGASAAASPGAIVLARTHGSSSCVKSAAAATPEKPASSGGFFSDVFSGIGSFFSAVGSGIGNVATRVGSAAIGILSGVVDAAKAVGHNLWENRHPARWLVGVRQSVEDVAILLGGRAVSTVQTLLFLEPPAERVPAKLATEMKKIFGDSLDIDAVRIKRGFAGVFSANPRPFAHGNVIYTKDDKVDGKLLSHELVHEWQLQNGGADYMAKALGAQAHDGASHLAAYDWTRAATEGKPWRTLNPEAQAELIGNAYDAGFFRGDERTAKFVWNGVDHTEYLKQALTELRAGRGAP